MSWVVIGILALLLWGARSRVSDLEAKVRKLETRILNAELAAERRSC